MRRATFCCALLVACKSPEPEPAQAAVPVAAPRDARPRDAALAPVRDRAVTIEVPTWGGSKRYPSVLRVVAIADEPSFDAPWTATGSRSTGTAVVIGPGLLLTNAHVVANAAPLDELPAPQPGEVIARVTAVSEDLDLALLEATLPERLQPLELGPMPAVGDAVTMVGFPVNVTGQSIVEGVVSNVQLQRYSNSQRELLAAGLDVAISAGSSGSAVFHDGKVAGIAFQKVTTVDNKGDMIPPLLIHAFLDAVKAGKSPEVPALGIDAQALDNPALRKQLGLPPDRHGVVVLAVDHEGSADGLLEPRDVITSIDGVPLHDDGNVDYLARYRLGYPVLLGTHHVGETIAVELVRAGQPRTVQLVLRPWLPLVSRAPDPAPRYFIYGGLVFQPLTRAYLVTWDEWWNKAPKELLRDYYLGHRTPQHHEVVVLTQILPDPINTGYEKLYNEEVAKLAGKPVLDLADLAASLSSARGIVEIETTSGGLIALDAAEVARTTVRILAREHIPHDRSPDLQ